MAVDIKGKLHASGLWPRFCERRDAYKALGVDPSDACDWALKELTPALAVWKTCGVAPDLQLPPPSSGGPGVSDAARCPAEEPPATLPPPPVFAPLPRLLPVEPAAKSVESDEGFSGLSDEERTEFMAREADIVEQYKWVGKYLYAPEDWLNILDAPCAQAWTLLLDARSSPDRKSDFLDKSYSRLLPSRAAIDSGVALDADGSHIVGTLDRLVAMRKAAEAGG